MFCFVNMKRNFPRISCTLAPPQPLDYFGIAGSEKSWKKIRIFIATFEWELLYLDSPSWQLSCHLTAVVDCSAVCVLVLLWQAGAAGPEASDAVSRGNKVTIITAVAKKKDSQTQQKQSIENKRGELMESNMDAMEVHISRRRLYWCVKKSIGCLRWSCTMASCCRQRWTINVIN